MKKLHLVFIAAFAMALVAAFALVGCSSGSSSASSASASGSSESAEASASAESAEASTSAASTTDAVELQVFAANSLEKALPEVQELYTAQTGVTFADTQFKASGDLVTQLQADSDAADLLITASGATMDKAVENGSVDESTRVDMFVNDLVVCAAEGSSIKVADLADLATDAIKSFAIGEPNTVPAGKYAVQSLEAAGLCTTETDADDVITVTWADSVKDKVNDGADKVGTVAQYVAGGQVDVGFVYSSDIYRYDGIETIYTVPADMHKPIKYPGAVVKDAKQAAAADDFMHFCLENAEAQAIFAKYGFELA